MADTGEQDPPVVAAYIPVPTPNNEWGPEFKFELEATNATLPGLNLTDVYKVQQQLLKISVDNHYQHQYSVDWNLKNFLSRAICPHIEALKANPSRADWAHKTNDSLESPYTCALYNHCKAVDNQILSIAQKAFPDSPQQQQWLVKVLSNGKNCLQEVQLPGTAAYQQR